MSCLACAGRPVVVVVVVHIKVPCLSSRKPLLRTHVLPYVCRELRRCRCGGGSAPLWSQSRPNGRVSCLACAGNRVFVVVVMVVLIIDLSLSNRKPRTVQGVG